MTAESDLLRVCKMWLDYLDAEDEGSIRQEATILAAMRKAVAKAESEAT